MSQVCSLKPDGQKKKAGGRDEWQKCQEKVRTGWQTEWFGIPLPFCIRLGTQTCTQTTHTQINSHVNAEVLSQDYESNCWLWTNINMVQSIPMCGMAQHCFFLPTFFFCEKAGVWHKRRKPAASHCPASNSFPFLFLCGGVADVV